jgi:hypothetical protein
MTNMTDIAILLELIKQLFFIGLWPHHTGRPPTFDAISGVVGVAYDGFCAKYTETNTSVPGGTGRYMVICVGVQQYPW